MDLVLFTCAGFVGGLFSSAPIGPINLWLIEKTAAGRKYRELLWFISGVIFADVVLAAAATWGFFHFLHTESFQAGVALIGGGVILIVGFSILLRRSPAATGVKDQAVDGAPRYSPHEFFTGLSFCGINPAFFAFWLLVIATLSEYFTTEPTDLSALAFLASIAVGDGVWFLILHRMVRKGVNLLSPRLSQRIRHAIGWIFILLGAYAIVAQLVKLAG